MRKPITRLHRGSWCLCIGAICISGCGGPSVPGSPGVPEPIKVLENPQTGERVRLFKEIWYKRPQGKRKNDYIVEWTTTQVKAGFTKEISTIDDRARWAEERARNRATARTHEAHRYAE